MRGWTTVHPASGHSPGVAAPAPPPGPAYVVPPAGPLVHPYTVGDGNPAPGAQAS
eukprot:gene8649-7881_t